MDPERDSIEEILRSVTEGAAVNWDDAIREAAVVDTPRVESLREVERIAAFHRELVRRSGLDSTVEAQGEAPGKVLERWGDLVVLERIGSGARSDVFRAWDSRLQREVALKLLRDVAETDVSDPRSSALLREGRALARVRHPHVVAVHGVEAREGRVGLWMQLVRGTTLQREIQSRGPLSVEDATRLGFEISSALAAVHEAGLVHRDVKPANIIRDADGRFVLLDLGLGTAWDEAARDGARPTGTPLYMAPELFSGAPASARTDVYSLGLVVWYALAGRHALDAASLDELRDAVRRSPAAIRTVRADTPAPLAAIVEKAISPSPDARFASANAMSDALRDVSMRRSGIQRHWLVLGGLSAIAILAAMFAVWSAKMQDRTELEVRFAEVASPAADVVNDGASVPDSPPIDAYTVDASFLLRVDGPARRLANGDRVSPGDRLSLELKTSRETWAYVLNEDDRGECYLLFPQPMFDRKNPLPANDSIVLPGTVDGSENAWTVTSVGGREHFLVVVSPEPIAELEAELRSIPAPQPGKEIAYAKVADAAVERLRGTGGIDPLPASAVPASPRAFERFRALTGQEEGVQGVWVRHVVLENPAK